MFDISKFREAVESFRGKLESTDGEITGIRLADDKWSLREIIGHLIDSAANNHQRFVRLQFDDLLSFPAYEGEKWIEVQKYIALDWNTLAALWYNYNCLILHIIENIDTAACGNVWVKDEETLTLESLINDYYRHLEQHAEHFGKRKEELLNRN